MPDRTRGLVAALAGLVALATLLLGCGSQAMPTLPQRPSALHTGTPQRLVALGASETAGIGTDDQVREAFPQRLLARLPRDSTLYQLGIPGETAGAALADELPAALRASPTLATVFFGVDDLAAGDTPAAYEANLDRIVGALRARHTRVLLANMPDLELLPAFGVCEQRLSSCPLKGVVLPPAPAVETLIAAYDTAAAQVAARQGATLVDLHAAEEQIRSHPEYVSSDGFHPSDQGAAALAGAFAAKL
jgi:lysophospholipase L1-like esterase